MLTPSPYTDPNYMDSRFFWAVLTFAVIKLVIAYIKERKNGSND